MSYHVKTTLCHDMTTYDISWQPYFVELEDLLCYTHESGRFLKTSSTVGCVCFIIIVCLWAKLAAQPLKPFTHSSSKSASSFDEKTLVFYLVVVETFIQVMETTFYNPQTYHHFLPKLTIGKNHGGVSTPAHNCIRVLSAKSFSAAPRVQVHMPLITCCLL